MRSQTKLKLTTLTLALTALLPLRTRAENISLTLDGVYDRDLSARSRHNNGAGGSAFFEIEPLEFLALGVHAGLIDYFGVASDAHPPLLASSLDGTLRLMPWGLRDRIESYLLLGAGLNVLRGDSLLGQSSWPGQYHFMGAIGLRFFFDPHMALDGSVGGDYFDPFNKPLTGLTARLGISFYGMPAYKDKVEENGRPEMRVGSLQYIAKVEYGDPDLYPLLVDANFKSTNGSLTLLKGAKLIVPRNLNQNIILKAHERASNSEYLRAASTFDNSEVTSQYRKRVTTLLESIPVSRKKRSTFPYRNEMNLWDIAARPDVYGDPELYSLLVEANKKRLKTEGFNSRFNLTIPRHVNLADLDKARLKAWSVEYILWRGKDVDQNEYQEWRKKHGLTTQSSNINADESISGDN